MSHYYPPGEQIVIAWQQLAFFWHEWEDYLLRGWRSIKLLPHFTWDTFYLQEAFCTSFCKMYSHERTMWSINWWPCLPSKFHFEKNFQLNVILCIYRRNSNVCIRSFGCWCACDNFLLGEDTAFKKKDYNHLPYVLSWLNFKYILLHSFCNDGLWLICWPLNKVWPEDSWLYCFSLLVLQGFTCQY